MCVFDQRCHHIGVTIFDFDLAEVNVPADFDANLPPSPLFPSPALTEIGHKGNGVCGGGREWWN